MQPRAMSNIKKDISKGYVLTYADHSDRSF
jgi:hypothetical protein